MISRLAPSLTGSVNVSVTVSEKLPLTTFLTVAFPALLPEITKLSSDSRLISICGLELSSLFVYQKYAIPASCGIVTVTSLAPATTLLPSFAAADGRIVDGPSDTVTAVASLDTPLTTCVTSTLFLGA